MDLEFGTLSVFEEWKKAHLPGFLQYLNSLVKPYEESTDEVDEETLENYKRDLNSMDHPVYSLSEHITITLNGKTIEGEARKVLPKLIEEVNALECMYIVATVFEATGNFEHDILLALYIEDEESIPDTFWEMITDSLPEVD